MQPAGMQPKHDEDSSEAGPRDASSSVGSCINFSIRSGV